MLSRGYPKTLAGTLRVCESMHVFPLLILQSLLRHIRGNEVHPTVCFLYTYPSITSVPHFFSCLREEKGLQVELLLYEM